MSSDSVELMIEKILTSTSLKHVHIEYVEYTEESASMFNLLESNKRLISLQFKNCLELNLVVPHVAKALHTNKKLKLLGMPSFYGIGSPTPGFEDVEELDEFPKFNIGDDGVKALIEMLKVNKTLETSAILTTELTADHVLALCDALQETEVPLYRARTLVLDPEYTPCTVIHPHIVSATEVSTTST